MSVTLILEDAKWRKLRLQGVLKRAVKLAFRETARTGSLTILLADDARLHALNLAFRGKDQPTNVLSFPAGAGGGAYLGDIAIAYGVTGREAVATDKTVAEHAAHLAVHGVLHLLGFDHIEPHDAELMEKTETAILAKLGISDPYVIASAGKL